MEDTFHMIDSEDLRRMMKTMENFLGEECNCGMNEKVKSKIEVRKPDVNSQNMVVEKS